MVTLPWFVGERFGTTEKQRSNRWCGGQKHMQDTMVRTVLFRSVKMDVVLVLYRYFTLNIEV